MKYIKCIVFGAVAFVVTGILYLITTIIILVHDTPKNTEIGFDVRYIQSAFFTPSLWMIGFWLAVVAAFALAFWSILRRTPVK
jgi:hypothetical protein